MTSLRGTKKQLPGHIWKQKACVSHPRTHLGPSAPTSCGRIVLCQHSERRNSSQSMLISLSALAGWFIWAVSWWWLYGSLEAGRLQTQLNAWKAESRQMASSGNYSFQGFFPRWILRHVRYRILFFSPPKAWWIIDGAGGHRAGHAELEGWRWCWTNKGESG